LQSLCCVHAGFASAPERQTPSPAQVPMRLSMWMHWSLVEHV
jgi:hypothetical protein